jgi:hypothetical protein
MGPCGYQCGQCSLAMVAGVPLEVACRVVGRKSATTRNDLLRGAKRLGLDVPSSWYNVVGKFNSKLGTALVEVRHDRLKVGHILAVINDVVHDPSRRAAGGPLEVGGYRVHAYLLIR